MTRFVWDEAKNRSNRRKHGLSFETARQLFTPGREYLVLFDEEHSQTEDRFVGVGEVDGGLIVVVWTEEEDVIRIISARKATRTERALFRSTRGRPHA